MHFNHYKGKDLFLMAKIFGHFFCIKTMIFSTFFQR